MYEGYNIIEKDGSPAKSRFSDPRAVSAVFQKLREDDLKEAERRTKIRGMFDGNLPYDPAKLQSCGLRNITNVNWLGLRSAIQARADVILKLSSDTTNLVEFRPMAREIAGPDAERVASVVAEEFSYTLREVGKFIPAVAMMNREADLFGLGPVTWMNSLDYTPIALERSQIQFFGNGPVLSSEHDVFMYESVLPAAYIFQVLDHEDVAASEGWNVKAVKEWAVRVFKDGFETASQPGVSPGMSVLESQLSLQRRNLFAEEHQFDEFKVIHVFVKEMKFPRGITHLIMPASGDSNVFLFMKENAYTKMDECFLWFPYSVSEKHARAVRGLASHLYPIEATMNRMKCAFVDSAFRGMTTLLTQAPGSGQQAISLNEQGPYTFIPKELTPVQNNVRPDLTQGITAMQFIDSVGIDAVAGTDRPLITQTGPMIFQGGNKPSKAEIEIQQKLRSRRDEALFTQRAAVIDKVVRQSFIRFSKLVALALVGDPVALGDYPEIPEFLMRCERRGVSPDQIISIPQMYTIATCRDLVLGSDGKVNALNEILAAYGGTMDEVGRKHAVRDVVQLRLGQVAADRYTAEVSRDHAPNDQASFATLENNQIKAGQPVIVGQDQLHWSHIPIHAQILQEIVEYVQAPEDNEGAPAASEAGSGESMSNPNANGQTNVENPRQVLRTLMAASQHIQEHLSIGGQQVGMEGEAQRVMKMIRDLRPTVKALNLAVATQERVDQAEREKEARELEEYRQKANEAELAKARYEVDKKAEVDRYRVDREHEVAMHKLQLTERRDENADIRANARASGDEARRDIETMSRIEAQQRLADAKVNAANAVNRFDAVNAVTGQSRSLPSDIMAPPSPPATDRAVYASL